MGDIHELFGNRRDPPQDPVEQLNEERHIANRQDMAVIREQTTELSNTVIEIASNIKSIQRFLDNIHANQGEHFISIRRQIADVKSSLLGAVKKSNSYCEAASSLGQILSIEYAGHDASDLRNQHKYQYTDPGMNHFFYSLWRCLIGFFYQLFHLFLQFISILLKIIIWIATPSMEKIVAIIVTCSVIVLIAYVLIVIIDIFAGKQIGGKIFGDTLVYFVTTIELLFSAIRNSVPSTMTTPAEAWKQFHEAYTESSKNNVNKTLTDMIPVPHIPKIPNAPSFDFSSFFSTPEKPLKITPFPVGDKGKISKKRVYNHLIVRGKPIGRPVDLTKTSRRVSRSVKDSHPDGNKVIFEEYNPKYFEKNGSLTTSPIFEILEKSFDNTTNLINGNGSSFTDFISVMTNSTSANKTSFNQPEAVVNFLEKTLVKGTPEVLTSHFSHQVATQSYAFFKERMIQMAKSGFMRVTKPIADAIKSDVEYGSEEREYERLSGSLIVFSPENSVSGSMQTYSLAQVLGEVFENVQRVIPTSKDIKDISNMPADALESFVARVMKYLRGESLVENKAKGKRRKSKNKKRRKRKLTNRRNKIPI
jgi:hypothetical protein